jgi:hypothetical protein CLOST_0911
MNIIADHWKDYEILDAGDGMKLERWKNVILSRPDPQAIWKPVRPDLWKQANAKYNRSKTGGGSWSFYKNLPPKWTIEYGSLKFYIEPTGFKHTGLFPEQAANWDWMRKMISERISCGRGVKVLNLFGYTGGATIAASAAGAEVCHVDASKGMVARARENAELTGLFGNVIRYIVDDAFKFVARELRRGNTYDAVIMDPPSYGRGPNGEVWKLEDQLFDFTGECMRLLSSSPLFFLLNSYTTGFSSSVTANILRMHFKVGSKGHIDHGDILLPISSMEGTFLPCGSYAAWKSDV